jgi:hypothetical protein
MPPAPSKPVAVQPAPKETIRSSLPKLTARESAPPTPKAAPKPPATLNADALTLELEQLDADVRKFAQKLAEVAPDDQKLLLKRYEEIYSTRSLLPKVRQWYQANRGKIVALRSGDWDSRLTNLEDRWARLRERLIAFGQAQTLEGRSTRHVPVSPAPEPIRRPVLVID